MKKFGTRLISAVLAGCMMTSVLPVSAFALEGSTEFERTVSAQENSDAPAEPSGEVAAACPLTSGNIIDKKFIADHGGSKVYSMSGTYTDGIVIDAENEDVVINVTGETTFDKDGTKDDCANFITVRNAKSVTVNAEGQTIKTAEGRGFIRCFYAADTFAGTAVLNGGTYNMQCDDIAACYLCGGDWTFNNLTMNAVLRAIETDKGANVIVNGGTYDCSESFSATFWINDSPSSSFTNVKATGVGWVMNAMNSQVNIVGGSYSRTYKDLPRYKDRPTLRVANSATLNVTDAEVTGTYCDVFVTGATANLVGGTYTNTNQYLNLGYESPALKVWNGGTLSVNGATVDCTGDNAAISSGEPAGSYYHYKYGDGGKLVVENCTIKNSKYGIYLGRGSSTSAELKSAKFENNESDIYLESGKKITISDTFTTPATIKVADPEEGRQLTVAGNANKLNLVGQNDYRVAYKKVHHYYYLTNRAPGYTLTAEGATATIKDEGVDVEVDSNDEIYEGTPVTLTADKAPEGLKFLGWTVMVDGVVQNDLLKFPNEEDQTKATFDMPAGNVTVRAVYEAVDPVEPPVDPVDPVDPVGPVDPVLPGVIIGGAVILGAYETGTGIYRLMNMQGLPLPSNRIELAELVWERAGKPEPQNMTDENLYADIDADDTDAQKAAHWMVEQELMKFDEDNNKFHPCFPVSKLRVCLTWQNAKDKGLID